MTSVTATMTVAAVGSIVSNAPGTVDFARYGLFGLLAWTALLTVPALASKAVTCFEDGR